MPGRCSSAGLLPRKITREDWNGSFTVRSASKQCFRLYKNTFCVAKCLLGKCPKPLCSAFFNAGCASRRDTFYPMIRSGSLRTCIRCDAASAREAYFICSGTGASRNEMPHSCIQKKLIWTSYAGCSIEKWLIERIDDKCESKYDQYTQLFSRLAKDIDTLAKAW